MWSTGDDIRQTAACPEQPGHSRLPLPGSHRSQAAAPVAPLVSSEAAGHLQGGYIDSQGAGHSHSGVSQRSRTDPRTNTSSSFSWCSTAGRSPDTDRTQTRAFSVAAPSIWNSLLCESVSTFKRHLKPICSDSLSPPVLQVPLYLRPSRQKVSLVFHTCQTTRDNGKTKTKNRWVVPSPWRQSNG